MTENFALKVFSQSSFRQPLLGKCGWKLNEKMWQLPTTAWLRLRWTLHSITLAGTFICIRNLLKDDASIWVYIALNDKTITHRERVGKRQWPNSTYCPGICLREPRKTCLHGRRLALNSNLKRRRYQPLAFTPLLCRRCVIIAWLEENEETSLCELGQ